ncbi:MAG: transglycosylase SLT domain-containing protein, partial [Myxococcota bacterium]|nr:transglycosylase SLT domain-containing protein [Myxococcota bacterium]
NGRAGDTVDLFDPPANIELSVDLLARLAHRFDERKPLIIAAYNAGSGRVKRWLDESSTREVDRFVEKIPIAQARHYVRSVTGTWAVYQYLNGCHCVADLSDDLRRLAGP